MTRRAARPRFSRSFASPSPRNLKLTDITFVTLTRNEEKNIGACLKSVPPAAVKLVYDAQSEDLTRAVAGGLGARVVTTPWRGFLHARQMAVTLVETPWTFMLDADERVTPELADELRALQPPEDVVAFSLPRRNVFCGRWIRGAGWWPDRLVRMFRTGDAVVAARSGTGDAALHEDWVPQGKSGQLKWPIEHHSYQTLEDYRRKFAEYTEIEAKNDAPGATAVFGAWLIVPLRFAWLYLGRRGLLDGWQGAYVSAGSALYPAAVATKAWRRGLLPRKKEP